MIGLAMSSPKSHTTNLEVTASERAFLRSLCSEDSYFHASLLCHLHSTNETMLLMSRQTAKKIYNIDDARILSIAASQFNPCYLFLQLRIYVITVAVERRYAQEELPNGTVSLERVFTK